MACLPARKQLVSFYEIMHDVLMLNIFVNQGYPVRISYEAALETKSAKKVGVKLQS